jgi:hypothetical protein
MERHIEKQFVSIQIAPSYKLLNNLLYNNRLKAVNTKYVVPSVYLYNLKKLNDCTFRIQLKTDDKEYVC